jgi:uncharacterized RDD family membrane protein YckC
MTPASASKDAVDGVASVPPSALPFWRRIAAFVVDGVALGVLFGIVGIVASPWFAALGSWGRVVGGAVGVAYFGFCGSSAAGGQTLGKRIARIAVRRRHGGNLPLGVSLARATLLMLPLTANGLALGGSTWVVPTVGSIVVFGLGGALLYLFFFNRQTRQSIHDLATGSIVVRVDQEPVTVQGTVWRAHFAIIAALLVAETGLAAFGLMKLRTVVNLDALRAAQRRIAVVANTGATKVMEGVTSGTGGRTTWVSVSAVTYVPPADQERLAREMAGAVLREVPAARTRDRLIVTISVGYDVLFARSWQSRRWDRTPREWQELAASGGT